MIKNILAISFETILLPITYLSSLTLLVIRKIGINKMPNTMRLFEKVGVYPLIDHYYEPLFNSRLLTTTSLKKRQLPGLDLNVNEQLSLLKEFTFKDELKQIPVENIGSGYYYNNPNFGSGDAEYLYSIIRHKKPARIIEIGSGFSTMMAVKAIEKNNELDPSYSCEHICIEPYEMAWLEKLPVKVLREKVETIDKSLFDQLTTSDILFIDSSHMIRPQSDVLCEYLEILPMLKSGVIVHIHDIFTPNDYPYEWLAKSKLFWNEQYLLEAFLSCNDKFRVIGALNYLKNNYFLNLLECFPILSKDQNREPGSFWIIRN